MNAKSAHIAAPRTVATTISGASHGQQHTTLCSLGLTLRQGFSAFPSPVPPRESLTSRGTSVPPARTGYMWDNGLVPETLILECPTAHMYLIYTFLQQFRASVTSHR